MSKCVIGIAVKKLSRGNVFDEQKWGYTHLYRRTEGYFRQIEN